MRLLATVTFNPNQLRSHLLPILALPEVDELVLVADAVAPPLPKLRTVVPSRRQRRILGRAGSKLVICAQLARRLHPDWILSWNVMPHGLNAFVAGRLSGSRTVYHMIGGEVEWTGGGWRSDNAVLGRLPRPLPPLERGLLGLVKRTDVVCTMGRDGRERLLARGLNPNRVFITPPSVDVDRFVPAPDDAPRPYDVVTVGELIPTKQLDDFVRIVQLLRRRRPTLSAAVAGDGPLREQIRRAAERHGVAQTIDFLGPRTDIEHVYRSGRVFVLTSRHEGLSVAMSEAMASGLPVVVTNVGDLSDLVQDGRNGFLLPVGDVEGFAERIESLLQDRVAYDAFGRAARAAVIVHASVSRLTDVYREILVSSE